LSADVSLAKNWPPALHTCVECHDGGGVRSLNSIRNLFKPYPRQGEPKNPNYGPLYWEDGAAIDWKQNRYDWGVLNGYWKASPGS